MADLNRAQRRPYGVACAACRRAKIKCVSTGLEANRCDRCVRLQRECLFESHRRGLWRREQHGVHSSRILEEPSRQGHFNDGDGGPSPYQAQDLASAGPSMHSSLHSSLQSSMQPSVQSSVPAPAQVAPVPQASQPTAPQSNFSSPGYINSSPGQATSPEASFTPPSFVMHSEDTRGLSLNSALDPDRVILGGSEGSDAAAPSHDSNRLSGQDDPIELKIISRPAARYLFDGFYKHFNCLVGLLDSNLYTFNYTRERSSLLFVSMLRISSRVFQPESHALLRQHSETLLGKALLACDSSIETIWAIVCMYYWKDVGDTRGYTMLGFALRMAVSAEWNKTRRRFAFGAEKDALPLETELQVRQRRDRDRVWLALGNVDRTSSYFTDRPLFSTPVSEESASRSWLGIDKWTYSHGDGKAIGGYELTQVARPIYDFMMKSRGQMPSYSTEEDNRAFQVAMTKFNEGMDEWGVFWHSFFSTFPDASEPWHVPNVRFFRDYMRLYFNSVLLHRILLANDNNALAADAATTIRVCYTSALSVLSVSVSLGKMDVLYYLWDTAHLMTAYAAMMLLKLLKQAEQVPGVSVEEGLEVLLEASNVYSAAAESMASAENPLGHIQLTKAPAASPVDAQARLLSAIVFRARSELRASSVSLRNDSISSTMTHHQPMGQLSTSMDNNGNSNNVGWDDSLRGMSQGGNVYPEGSQSNQVAQLTDEMDFSLEGGFVDARFMDVGLISWDQPGIFIDPR